MPRAHAAQVHVELQHASPSARSRPAAARGAAPTFMLTATHGSPSEKPSIRVALALPRNAQASSDSQSFASNVAAVAYRLVV